MRLERMLSQVRSMIRTDIENRDVDKICQHVTALIIISKDRILELEKELASTKRELKKRGDL